MIIEGPITQTGEAQLENADLLWSVLAKQISKELSLVSDDIRVLEDFVAQHFNSETMGAHLRDLQSIDRVQQSVAALAGLLESLSVEMPDQIIDPKKTVAHLKLGEMRNRLSQGE